MTNFETTEYYHGARYVVTVKPGNFHTVAVFKGDVYGGMFFQRKDGKYGWNGSHEFWTDKAEDAAERAQAHARTLYQMHKAASDAYERAEKAIEAAKAMDARGTVFRVVLHWNGREVGHGIFTAAMAYETVRAFIVGNFVKPGFYPSLAAILAMQPGDEFGEAHEDETGKASYLIERT